MTSAGYLIGKHAIITGGGRGIGAAIAWELAQLQAQVSLMGRNEEVLAEQASRLVGSFGIRVEYTECDIHKEQSVTRAFTAVQKKLGPAYVLVNNAGQAEGAAFLDTSRKLWDEMLNLNLTGTFLCTQQVLPAMLEARSGRIINIASTAGLKGYSHVVAYCASKHGVIGLTRALAAETVRCGITVNAVCPAYTEGQMTDRTIDTLSRATSRTKEEAREMLVRKIPRGSLIRPEEVANAVGWLCAPEASAITGQAIVVAGGEVT